MLSSPTTLTDTFLPVMARRWRTHTSATAPKDVVGETAYQIAGTDGRVVAIRRRIDSNNGEKRMWWERPGGVKGLGGLAVADLRHTARTNG